MKGFIGGMLVGGSIVLIQFGDSKDWLSFLGVVALIYGIVLISQESADNALEKAKAYFEENK